MKCVILASGRGERMRPLTDKTPKPLLKVKGKCLIDYVLESLPREIDEIIIAVRYKGRQIKKHVGKEFRGKKVRYVRGSSKGNAYSFLATRKYLNNERFLLIYGDELPDPNNVKRCLAKDLSVLVYRHHGWHHDGIMVLNTRIFNYPPKITGSENFDTMVNYFCAFHFVNYLKAINFIGEVNTPKDLERLNNG